MIALLKRIASRRREWQPRPFPLRRWGIRIELRMHPSDPAKHRWRAHNWWSAFLTSIHQPRT